MKIIPTNTQAIDDESPVNGKCVIEGCSKKAIAGFRGGQPIHYCYSHFIPNEMSLPKICHYEKCNSKPRYGHYKPHLRRSDSPYPLELPIFCNHHKRTDMQFMYICQVYDCHHRGFADGKYILCTDHQVDSTRKRARLD
jgi:hypothetical protein